MLPRHLHIFCLCDYPASLHTLQTSLFSSCNQTLQLSTTVSKTVPFSKKEGTYSSTFPAFWPFLFWGSPAFHVYVTLLCVKCSLGKLVDGHKIPNLQLHDLTCIKTTQNFSKLYHLSALPPSEALLWGLFLIYLLQNITHQASLHRSTVI